MERTFHVGSFCGQFAKMKIRTLSRSRKEHTRERPQDIHRVSRNLDPKLHPFARQREYVRARNAVKLDKMFAKPFVGALDGHADGVYAMATSPKSLVGLITGAGDGEVRVWDIAQKRTLWSVRAHRGIVKGVTVSNDGRHFFSCGKDAIIKQYPLAMKVDYSYADDDDNDDDDDDKMMEWANEPVKTWSSSGAFTDIDHHWYNSSFATSGMAVQIWDSKRSEPVQSLKWGTDTVESVAFNPAEVCLLGSVTSDRHIVLHDVRDGKNLRKVTMSMKLNAFAWNPMEPLNFTVASEDHNCYTYDMRKLKRSMMVHKDHVGAVMSISYSPTGREFVTGSYDRTVRIFRLREGRSREVYHTRRMQRVFCVGFSSDSEYVLSGSDDTNVRVWKTNASKTQGRLLPRERNKLKYMAALRKRFQHVPELKRIIRHQHLPRVIKKMGKRKQESRDKESRKLKNRKLHSKPGTVKGMPERERYIIKEHE